MGEIIADVIILLGDIIDVMDDQFKTGKEKIIMVIAPIVVTIAKAAASVIAGEVVKSIIKDQEVFVMTFETLFFLSLIAMTFFYDDDDQ